MVADHLGPVVREVNVGLSAQPWQRLRVADERIACAVLAVAGKVADLEGDLAAGGKGVIGAVRAITRDAELACIVFAVVGLLCRVAQVGNTDAPLGKQGGRENVVVVAAGAVGCRGTSGLKATAARRATEERTEERRLVGIGRLMAEAAAQMVLLGNGVVGLDVVAPHVLVEGQVGREVVRRGSRDVVRVSQVILGVRASASRSWKTVTATGLMPGFESGMMLPAKGVRPVPQYAGVGPPWQSAMSPVLGSKTWPP